MRFMMLMIPAVYQGKAGREAGPEFVPDANDVEKMMRYNEELAKSGALIALDGLHSPTSGVTVSFKGGRPLVTEGRVSGSENVLGGYWMINVKSRQEAIDWAKRVPARPDDLIEVRQVFEIDEFPEDVRALADSPIVKAQVQKKGKG